MTGLVKYYDAPRIDGPNAIEVGGTRYGIPRSSHVWFHPLGAVAYVVTDGVLHGFHPLGEFVIPDQMRGIVLRTMRRQVHT